MNAGKQPNKQRSSAAQIKDSIKLTVPTHFITGLMYDFDINSDRSSLLVSAVLLRAATVLLYVLLQFFFF